MHSLLQAPNIYQAKLSNGNNHLRSPRSCELKQDSSFHSNTTLKTRLTTILNQSASSQNCALLTRTPSQASSSTPPLQQQKSISATITTTTTNTTSTSKQATIDEYLNNEADEPEDDDTLFRKYTKDYQNNLDYYLNEESKFDITERK
jgi:hypothetical protein